jgi:hypothetical protein
MTRNIEPPTSQNRLPKPFAGNSPPSTPPDSGLGYHGRP